MLAAEAVSNVVAQLSGRGSSRPRTPDEWYELVRNHGAINRQDLIGDHFGNADENAVERRRTIAELERGKRIYRIRMRPDAPEALIASEDAALFGAAYPELSFGEIDLIVGVYADPDRAGEELVRRALATSGPVTISQLGERLLLPLNDIASDLVALEASGAIFRRLLHEGCADGSRGTESRDRAMVRSLRA